MSDPRCSAHSDSPIPPTTGARRSRLSTLPSTTRSPGSSTPIQADPAANLLFKMGDAQSGNTPPTCGSSSPLGTPWVYDYAGAPYRTEAVVHELLTSVYADSPGGEPGNGDLGSMSSWYVWSAFGMYRRRPACQCSRLGAPIFLRVEFDLPGRTTITAPAPRRQPTCTR